MSSPSPTSRRTVSTRTVLALGTGVARHRPLRYALVLASWTAWWCVPVLTGLVLRAVFDAISGAQPAGLSLPALLVVLLAVEGSRLAIFYGSVVLWVTWYVEAGALLRSNLLRSQLASGGGEAGPPVRGSAAAIPAFRDDVDDVLWYVDGWLDLAGTLIFTLGAIAVMVRIDATLTLVVVLPLAAVFAITRAISERLRDARHRDREATADVTGFVGEVCGGVLAVKVAGAEDAVIGRLGALNARRRRTALRDRLLSDGLKALNSSTVDVSIGLVLLLVAGAMRAGEFTLGDLALFASYLTALASLPRWAGILLTRHRHVQVAAGRMAGLLPGGDPLAAVARRTLQLWEDQSPARPRSAPEAPADVRLEGFGVLRSGGVTSIDLHLPAGSFTVLCGPVGAGKTTLLRGLVGLVGPVEGAVRWNGAALGDLAAHMVPPRCAYVPQVARLFTGSLRDNLTLGLDTPEGSLRTALRHAAFDGDVAGMADGLATAVGARGVRLSGGQLQRAATARALAGGAALLVLDDISSALDAHTERRLWEALRAERSATVLVVSHRPAALARADQIVVLAEGRVRAIGTLDELRSRGLDPLAGGGGQRL